MAFLPRKLLPPRGKARLIALGVLALVAALGLWAIRSPGKEGAQAQVQFVAVEKGDIEEVVTAQGKLEPKEFVDVGVQVSGQLQKIHVAIGDVVTQGQLLAEIDPRVYQSRVEADRAGLKTLGAQLAEQQATLTFAQQQHARNQRLIAANAISQEALEDTASGLKVAQAKLASLKAQAEQAQSALEGDTANLSYTKIYAPMAGTVVLQPVREGQTLNASQSAPVVLQLADLDIMTVRAQVAEADVMRLTEGMACYFTTLGATQRKWGATVRQILPSPETINDVVLYNVLVDVDNTDRQLMTGMSTQMFFVMGSAKDVTVVPANALGKRLPKEDGDAGQAYQVRVQAGGGVEEKTVHVGLMSRTLAEIRSGLAVGDSIAIPVRKSDAPRGGGGAPRGPTL